MIVTSQQMAADPDRVSVARRVLLIEDVDATRRRMSDTLRTHGYNVIEASDGRDALQKISSGPFDAIVLDLIMPNVDGWQFRATQLRHPELATIPTVVVSVQPLRESDRYVLRVRNTMRKPFEDADLLDTVQRACAESPRHAALANAQPAVPGLYWSHRGVVACEAHAPAGGSPQWVAERWAAIPAWAGRERIVYQCQFCPGGGGPIRHRRGTK